MDDSTDETRDSAEPDVEFLGITLKVADPSLAALLNSSVDENVVVIGRRTVDLLARADGEEGLEDLEDLEGPAVGADQT